MSPSAALSWITSEAQAAGSAWRAKLKERTHDNLRGGYFFLWVIRPVFDMAIAALIYAGGRKDLVPYLVVSMTANAVLWTSVFWVGEILDRERINGTLVPLFLVPCARLSWLAGFAFAGLGETLAAAFCTAFTGWLIFGVHYNPNLPALLVSVALFVIAMTGLGLVQSGAGLLIKKANQLSNLILPILLLLGGVYFPVSDLPTWLRIPARALPMGYGMDAISQAALHHASIGSLGGSLLPLAGFAVVLPIIGVITFNALERVVRRRGELDLF